MRRDNDLPVLRIYQNYEVLHKKKKLLVCDIYGMRQNKFPYRNRKMVKLRLRSDMITILLINHEG